MKKFLSLVLALVMTMSLVTVSAGAKDFTDDKSITYDEAVAVMSEVKVIDGYTDGSFQPTTNLTRGAAAKIICNLILGPTTAAALGADTAPYSDVPVNHTFAGYIAYCQKTGIISGYADGTFKPAAPLTGYAFMKMLLGALGYNSDVEGYTGANWSINVAKQAIAIGLAKGNDDFTGQAYVNREEACLYSLNTLKATMVEYPQTTTVTVNGADVVLSSARTEVAWGTALKNNDGNIKKDGYVQFAEKYFPNLELEVGEGIYGRPANTWKNKKSEIGTFTSIDPTYVYTESMEEGDVYKDLGGVITDEDEYDWSFFINGVEQKSGTIPAKNNDDEWVYTGEGTVTEIYVDDIENTVDVIEYNYYLGQVSKVKSDDDGEYINISVLSKGASGLDDKTFYVEGFEEDDYVVFTMDENDDDDMVIGEVFEPETVTGTVTRVEKDTNTDYGKVTGETYLKMDSDKYVYSEDPAKDPAQQRHMVYDLSDVNVKVHPTLDEDYILYMDPNGYVLGFELAEETVDQYLFVKDSDEELSDWVAKAYLPDGTTAKVDLDDELNKTPTGTVRVPSITKDIVFAGNDDITWVDNDTGSTTTDKKDRSNIDGLIWKYTVDSKGVYELTYVQVSANSISGKETQNYVTNAEINNGKAYVTIGNDSFIVDKKTVFVDVDNETVYTGYDEVPNVEHGTLAYVLDGRVASVVFIIDGDIYDEGNIYFMLSNDKRESFKYDGASYWTYLNAYVNGEKTTLNVKYNADRSDPDTVLDVAPALYQVKKTIDENYITEVVKVTTGKHDVIAVGTDAFWADMNNDGSTTTGVNEKFDVNDETVFVVVEKDLDGDYRIYDGRLDDMSDKDYDIQVQVLKDDDQTAELVYIYKDEISNIAEINEVQVASGVKTDKVYKNIAEAVKNPIVVDNGTAVALDITKGSGIESYRIGHSAAATAEDEDDVSGWGDPSGWIYQVRDSMYVVKFTATAANGDDEVVRYVAVKVVNQVALTATGANARVTIDGKVVDGSVKYAAGDKVTIKVVAADGYKIDTVVYDGSTLTGFGGEYDLTVAAGETDITVTASAVTP